MYKYIWAQEMTLRQATAYRQILKNIVLLYVVFEANKIKFQPTKYIGATSWENLSYGTSKQQRFWSAWTKHITQLKSG